MKKVTVIFKRKDEMDLLEFIKSTKIKGATFNEVRGFGRQYGHKELISGKDFKINLLPKMKMEAIVLDEEAEDIVLELQEFLQTGRMGDGKIWVENVEDAVRIRTGESGVEAVK